MCSDVEKVPLVEKIKDISTEINTQTTSNPNDNVVTQFAIFLLIIGSSLIFGYEKNIKSRLDVVDM